MMTKLKFYQLHPYAKLPTYGSAGAACFDFYSIYHVEIGRDKAVPVNTGLCVEIPEGFCMLIYSRSGMGSTKGIRLANSVAVVDSDYRGEIICYMRTDNRAVFEIRTGDRIAQGMLIPTYKINPVFADQLSPTIRGAGGFGSTGA